MGRYLIERNFGAISDDDMLAAAVLSDQVATERFPEIVWEHSHIVMGDDGQVLTFCIYGAPTEEMIREHARRGGFPANKISQIRALIDPTTAE